MPNANNFCKPAVPPMVMERWGGLLSLQDDGETLNLIFCGIDLGPAFDFDVTGWEGTWFTFHAWFMCLYDFKGSWLPLFAVLLWMIWLRLSMKKSSEWLRWCHLPANHIYTWMQWVEWFGWMDGWMGGWVDGWMGGWMDGWADEQTDVWVSEGLKEWMNQRMIGWTDVWVGMEWNEMEWNGMDWNGMERNGWNGMERMEWNHGWMEPKECLASDWRNGWTTEINKSFFVDNMRTRGGPQHHVTISNQTIMSNSKFETSKCIWNIKMPWQWLLCAFSKTPLTFQ